MLDYDAPAQGADAVAGDAVVTNAVETGQTWIPSKAGTGWRYICEVRPSGVRYRLRSGRKYWQWTWQFNEWVRRFECILAPKP